MSASHNIINLSISSPASNNNRLTAESVTISCASTIGRRCRATIFFTNSILWFRGSFNFLKIPFTILLPINSWAWNVHPIPSSYFFVCGFAMSCKIAAHRNHRSSEFLQILSSTSNVWKKLSLWEWLFIFSTPCNLHISLKNWCSKFVLNNNLKPLDGLSHIIILFSSSVILSFEIISNLLALFFIALSVRSSILKLSWLANLIALIILNGSSLKVVFGSNGVLIILFFRSSFPLNGSRKFPKFSLLSWIAIALIVKSLLFWSSSKVPSSTIGFLESLL